MTSFTNSPFVSFTRISPNKTAPRDHVIDTVTVHCVEGQCTVEALGGVFADPARRASSNYGIGYDGKIGMYVEEKDRSWCSSSAANDHRAVTIEVASDPTPPYAVTAAAYDALIALLADVCRRNGIQKLLFEDDRALIGMTDRQNMTLHRWFADTSCPGEYLCNLHPQIAREVNALLAPLAPGDLVAIRPGASYFNGKPIPAWVLAENWYVESVDDRTGRVVIDRSEDGKHRISSAVSAADLILIAPADDPAGEPGNAGGSIPEESPDAPQDAFRLEIDVRKTSGRLDLSLPLSKIRDLIGYLG